MNRQHFSNSPASLHYFYFFTQGDENGLDYLYRQLFNPLVCHGLQIIKDEFSVNTIVQDAFLKCWRFRDRLTSLLHAYRFMRMNVSWDCYDYYKQPANRLISRGVILENLPDNTDISDLEEKLDGADKTDQFEELLQSVYNVIPYLPPNRQTILTLYFKYGFSHKQIAKRYAASSQSISIELQKGLEHLKKIIHAKKRLTTTNNLNKERPYAKYLEGDLLTVFTLRKEKKLGFDEIDRIVNFPQSYVLQQYILAYSKLMHGRAVYT